MSLQVKRSFHRVWVGAPMPDIFVGFGEGWQRFHPEWEMCLWGELEIASLDLVNQKLYDEAEEITPKFAGQLRSDIVRYELLWRYGGVYIDTDYECLASIEPLLDGVECFAAWERQDETANNAILGAVPGHPFMKQLIDNLEESVRSRPGKRPSQVSGPRYLTRQLQQTDEDVTVFPEQWFYPYRCDELHRCNEEFSEAYAVHHWANQRRLRRKPL